MRRKIPFKKSSIFKRPYQLILCDFSLYEKCKLEAYSRVGVGTSNLEVDFSGHRIPRHGPYYWSKKKLTKLSCKSDDIYNWTTKSSSQLILAKGGELNFEVEMLEHFKPL